MALFCREGGSAISLSVVDAWDSGRRCDFHNMHTRKLQSGINTRSGRFAYSYARSREDVPAIRKERRLVPSSG
jgi:hypothetical protein